MHWQIGGRQVISPLASALMVKVNELLSWIFVYFNSSTSDVNPFQGQYILNGYDSCQNIKSPSRHVLCYTFWSIHLSNVCKIKQNDNNHLHLKIISYTLS